MLFAYFYIFLIIMVLVLSLALPLEKGKAWFHIVVGTFSILTVFSIFGMVYYLAVSSFYPPEKKYLS